MLIPKRTKYRKQFRGRMKGDSYIAVQLIESQKKLDFKSRYLRRFRPGSYRTGMDHQPSDRSSTYCHDPLHQARRQGLDQDFPG